MWRLRTPQGPAGRLAVEVGNDARSAERIGPALRQALADPSIEVRRWDDRRGLWVGEGGAPADPPEADRGRSVLVLEREGLPVAAVLHDAVLLEDPGLLASIGAVLRLTIENERLGAEVRRQLAEVSASRARILAATDRERRRIERDLHDGAQHRLLALSMNVQEARRTLQGGAPAAELLVRLDALGSELNEAIRELRELARGVHPAVLTSEGLDPAVRALTRRSVVPVDLRIDLDGRLPAAQEMTAYYVVAEGLANVARHAQASRASVHVARASTGLIVEVSDDGIGATRRGAASGSGLRGLADRVAVLGGTLAVGGGTSGGTALRVEMPCE